MLVQMFWHTFHKNWKQQHLRSLPRATESQGLMRFPHQYPPPRPRPLLFCASTAALASRSRSTTESWPSRAAQCSGVLPREPQPEAKPRAEPNGTKGRKFWENFDASKVEVWESVATQCFSLNLRNMTCLENIALVEKTVAFGLLSKPCQPYLQSRCAWINPN